ncbi:uncharacterized protein LOC132711536 isoform X2 [Pantherophis guttatus]|uniref:Uncharacterized protein LOC132711536 isoform X2 n=1 Tax=Pantherophis guttatus TaxID=94885 RepID=A0ABM3ZEI9_PANGU|nr:uncharacterized protein LOC132711536 isoform X2 [Pantherophis guttatus]
MERKLDFFLKENTNEDTTLQNLWDTTKASQLTAQEAQQVNIWSALWTLGQHLIYLGGGVKVDSAHALDSFSSSSHQRRSLCSRLLEEGPNRRDDSMARPWVVSVSHSSAGKSSGSPDYSLGGSGGSDVLRWSVRCPDSSIRRRSPGRSPRWLDNLGVSERIAGSVNIWSALWTLGQHLIYLGGGVKVDSAHALDSFSSSSHQRRSLCSRLLEEGPNRRDDSMARPWVVSVSHSSAGKSSGSPDYSLGGSGGSDVLRWSVRCPDSSIRRRSPGRSPRWLDNLGVSERIAGSVNIWSALWTLGQHLIYLGGGVKVDSAHALDSFSSSSHQRRSLCSRLLEEGPNRRDDSMARPWVVSVSHSSAGKSSGSPDYSLGGSGGSDVLRWSVRCPDSSIRRRSPGRSPRWLDNLGVSERIAGSVNIWSALWTLGQHLIYLGGGVKM